MLVEVEKKRAKDRMTSIIIGIIGGIILLPLFVSLVLSIIGIPLAIVVFIPLGICGLMVYGSEVITCENCRKETRAMYGQDSVKCSRCKQNIGITWLNPGETEKTRA